MNRLRLTCIGGMAFICLHCSTESTKAKITIKAVFDMSPAKVEYEYENGRKVEKPVFFYDPREDAIKSLKNAGFKVIQENNQKFDLILVAEYDERYSSHRGALSVSNLAFVLQDKDGSTLLKQRLWPVYDTINAARHFFTEELPELIKGRLAADDEVCFLISQVKQGESLGVPVKFQLVESNIKHLVRLWELQDNRTIEVFKSMLQSPDERQRWIAKFALLDLNYKPAAGTRDEVAFKMVNTISGNSTVALNFLGSRDLLDRHKENIKRTYMRTMIIKYGPHAIELIIENLKCECIRDGTGPFFDRLGNWYGGGSISEIDPARVLKDLTENRWNEYTERYTDPSGMQWQQQWNEAAVSKLIEVISAEHKELATVQKWRLYSFALDVLGYIADKRAIEHLKKFLSAHPDSTRAKEAIEKIEKRGT